MKGGTTRGIEARQPVLDFPDNSESAVPTGQTVKAATDDFTLEGNAEIKLDLVPVPSVYRHGAFDD